MSRDVVRLCKGMSDSVWVKAMGLGRGLADIRLTLDSKLLFNLVAASQSGRPKPYGMFPRIATPGPDGGLTSSRLSASLALKLVGTGCAPAMELWIRSSAIL